MTIFSRVLLGMLSVLAAAIAQTPSAAPRSAAFSDGPGANLPAQKIGPNDLLSVSVYDAPEFTRTVRVGSDGQIILPMMKHSIAAAGLMPAQLEVAIADALRDQNLLNDATVIVTVAEYLSRPITVTGAVKSPVTFQAMGQVTLTDALTRAGGLAPEAGAEILVIPPPGGAPGLLRRIPAKALLDASDPKLNLVLLGGEEVRVPAAGRIFVLGNVKNSNSFPIQDQSDTTVLDALTLAGGFAGPVPKEAWIIRVDDASPAKHQISIPMKDIVDRKAPDVTLVAHDILFVPNNRRSEALSTLEKIVAVGATGAILVNVAK